MNSCIAEFVEPDPWISRLLTPSEPGNNALIERNDEPRNLGVEACQSPKVDINNARRCDHQVVVNMPGCRQTCAGNRRRDTMWRMSIYRSSLKRSPLSDVHQVPEHIVGPKRTEQQTAPIPLEQDFKSLRKAKPSDVLLPRTARWIAALPLEVRPVETAKAFPRIANALALLWSTPDELTVYLDELLVDRRGGRQGFPLRVLSEFDMLREYCACPLQETDS